MRGFDLQDPLKIRQIGLAATRQHDESTREMRAAGQSGRTRQTDLEEFYRRHTIC